MFPYPSELRTMAENTAKIINYDYWHDIASMIEGDLQRAFRLGMTQAVVVDQKFD